MSYSLCVRMDFATIHRNRMKVSHFFAAFLTYILVTLFVFSVSGKTHLDEGQVDGVGECETVDCLT